MDSRCSLHKVPNCIESVPIFSSITEEELLKITAITTDRTYQKGEMVYLQGDEGGKLYVLHKGRVKITRLGTSGKEQVIRVLGPGAFMGELSLLSPVPMTDNAEALETTTMCMIDGKELKGLMLENPSIALKIIEELSRRLESVEELVEDINLLSVEQRLAQVLLKLAGDGDEIVLKMRKSDLASQIGMSQETLSRKLSSFQEQGLIELEGQRKIRLLDRAGLKETV
ncbi:MAG TPA: Crp/Fnr family transcriptional regulator [Bacillota bacterium]|nr:Crp/Fnr family transcriptional regulator [Bacillota bacterium]HOH11025.1 Crp/Fnr family transcriptional regulator [Bacillota bacterium]HPI02006.1 Crp/Fnr family transcriptional regulator [Bacillota bacterium]HPM64564.1 Crp/Fnr family transcriptional regulator [Bacillota bacterium]